MESIEIKKNPQIHCMSGGIFEEYTIKYGTSIMLTKKDIEDIKNGNVYKKDRKTYKHLVKAIGTIIINDLFSHIQNEEA